jgi:hypothetical protein
VATHWDGSLTVSHRAGHGVVTLPADYARDHVRLGYAATEHGNQADTVDVAIELVSTATTHRGLYVGATRGRDENRIHVITDTNDVTDARDVLETALAHDRADIPAVTQRRNLARQARSAHPRQPEPASIVPDWVGPSRAGLEQQREKVVDYLDDRARRRADAAVELADLQPTLGAARAAWQPYRDAIGEIEDGLRSGLRPAMWKASMHAVHAGFGHHHATARRAKAANDRVAEAEAVSPPSTPARPPSNSDWTWLKRKHGTSTTSRIPHRPDSVSRTCTANSSTRPISCWTPSTCGPRGPPPTQSQSPTSRTRLRSSPTRPVGRRRYPETPEKSIDPNGLSFSNPFSSFLTNAVSSFPTTRCVLCERSPISAFDL